MEPETSLSTGVALLGNETHQPHRGYAHSACRLKKAPLEGEGIVSQRLSAPYRSGPSRDKVKNPDSRR
jgi:hypothetical protein